MLTSNFIGCVISFFLYYFIKYLIKLLTSVSDFIMVIAGETEVNFLTDQ